jgi:deoxyribodipyrimidine photolyase
MSNLQKKHNCLIVWLRRELRLNYNFALWSAVQDAQEIIPLYILDSGAPQRNPGRCRIITEGLNALRLRGRLKSPAAAGTAPFRHEQDPGTATKSVAPRAQTSKRDPRKPK